jgi:hypothetical protein
MYGQDLGFAVAVSVVVVAFAVLAWAVEYLSDKGEK